MLRVVSVRGAGGLAITVLWKQTVCPSAGKKPACKSGSFLYVEDSRECIDYQEIKIQEQVQSLSVGSIPRSIVVVLENDLVDSCKVRGFAASCVCVLLFFFASQLHATAIYSTSTHIQTFTSIHTYIDKYSFTKAN